MAKSVMQKLNEQEYKNLDFYRSAIRRDEAMKDARHRFEKWYTEDMKSYAGPLTKIENGQYLYVEMLWRAWNASSSMAPQKDGYKLVPQKPAFEQCEAGWVALYDHLGVDADDLHETAESMCGNENVFDGIVSAIYTAMVAECK